VLKDPAPSQNALKAYVSAYRNLELGRLDYVRTLNDVNINFNIELIDKMCGIFKNKMVSLRKFFILMEKGIFKLIIRSGSWA